MAYYNLLKNRERERMFHTSEIKDIVLGLSIDINETTLSDVEEWIFDEVVELQSRFDRISNLIERVAGDQLEIRP